MKGQPGYRNIGVELMVLTSLFRRHPVAITGTTVSTAPCSTTPTRSPPRQGAFAWDEPA